MQIIRHSAVVHDGPAKRIGTLHVTAEALVFIQLSSEVRRGGIPLMGGSIFGVVFDLWSPIVDKLTWWRSSSRLERAARELDDLDDGGQEMPLDIQYSQCAGSLWIPLANITQCDRTPRGQIRVRTVLDDDYTIDLGADELEQAVCEEITLRVGRAKA